MKKRSIWKKTGILLLIFVVALVVSSLLTNRGTADRTVGLSDPTLPQISFMIGNQVMNMLTGYTDEMDITAMRDTITPVPDDGVLTMNLQRNGQDIQSIRYEVCSLDGETTYIRKPAKDSSGTNVALELNDGFAEGAQESVLKVVMEMGNDETVYFYTRIEKEKGLWLNECLAFAQDFHEKAITGTGETLGEYLEPGEESDNTTYQTVNIHSDITHIQWGDLKPEVSTDVAWSIKESNRMYTSLLADYRVVCQGDSGEKETFHVKEFFRVRCSQQKMYLLDYNRTMNQIFNGNEQAVDDNRILLGMTEDDVDFAANKKGTVISFVQERELWTYDVKSNELSMVFSFTDTEGRDERSRNDSHEVRIISMDENGSTTFAVYGYMNRGTHEGKVGVNVYYFDIEKNAVNEIAFIPSTKSFVIAKDELGKMVYYNQQSRLLYVLAGGVLYRVDVASGKQEELAKQLTEGQYVASEDGHLLAYQIEGNLNTSKKICVMNLETGKSYEVKAPKGASVRPLGFIKNDFICGYLRTDDQGTTVSGEDVTPMYELEIFGASNESLKKYSQEGVYISDILVEKNLVTINRVTKSGEIYTGSSQDYITSNEEREDRGVSLETFSSKRKERQQKLVLKEEMKDRTLRILRPKLVSVDDAVTISFDDKKKTNKYYVYGVGELVGVYDKAAYAIQKAEQISGVVISSEQAYVWEKGNRDLEYYTDTEAFAKTEGESSYEACVKYMEQFGANRMDLTGCTLSQVLYIINKGMPVIAMTDSSHAILLTGYGMDTVTYVNPDDGEMHTVMQDEMNEMLSGSGNAFIGYCK